MHHAVGDADRLIVKKDKEDTEPKQNSTRRSKIWDIQLCQQALGSDCGKHIIHSCNLRT